MKENIENVSGDASMQMKKQADEKFDFLMDSVMTRIIHDRHPENWEKLRLKFQEKGVDGVDLAEVDKVQASEQALKLYDEFSGIKSKIASEYGQRMSSSSMRERDVVSIERDYKIRYAEEELLGTLSPEDLAKILKAASTRLEGDYEVRRSLSPKGDGIDKYTFKKEQDPDIRGTFKYHGGLLVWYSKDDGRVWVASDEPFLIKLAETAGMISQDELEGKPHGQAVPFSVNGDPKWLPSHNPVAREMIARDAERRESGKYAESVRSLSPESYKKDLDSVRGRNK